MLLAIAASAEAARVHQQAVLEVLHSGPASAHHAVARVLDRLPPSPEVCRGWCRLLWSEETAALAAAVAALSATGRPLSELGVGPDELRSLPVRALAGLLSALSHEQYTAFDLLPILQRPEVEARRAAATALTILGTPNQEIVAALLLSLEDEDDIVASQCASALVRLGLPEHGWVLLRSPILTEQQRGAELVSLTGVSRPVVEAFAAGRLWSPLALEILRQQPPDVLGTAIEDALEASDFSGAGEFPRRLASLGVPALERVPEWLGSSNPSRQQLGMRVLECILATGLEVYVEWIAQKGLVLPLEDPRLGLPLQTLLARFLGKARAGSHPGVRPLLSHLLSSPAAEVASLALSALSGPEQAVLNLDLLDNALRHPDGSVRRRALREIRVQLPLEQWPLLAAAAAEFQEGVLLQRLHLFALERLEGPVLAETLVWIDDLGLQLAGLLDPVTPTQALQLLEVLSAPPPASSVAMLVLWNYTGPITPALWRTILSAARAAPGWLADQLAQRWPRVVPSILLRWQDGVDWVVGLGKHGDDGLILALKHRHREVRSRALEVLEAPGTQRARCMAALRMMSHEEPVEFLRRRAARVLATMISP